VNLYPFEATAAKAELTAEELIENIDIGGPTMLRSAAKNWESVTVVTDPADYQRVAAELEASRDTCLATRLELARKVFATTSRYDGMIATELERLSVAGGHAALVAKEALPQRVYLALKRQQPLRYGENPHQAVRSIFPRANLRRDWQRQSNFRAKNFPTTTCRFEAARSIAAEFQKPAVIIAQQSVWHG
jgi:phosphoribosylaminoimidazolecarboxamide formyltransferase/IMP cyclohydrolase